MEPIVSQVLSDHVQSFCDHMRRQTVMKDRHCELMAATWPHDKRRTPAERLQLQLQARAFTGIPLRLTTLSQLQSVMHMSQASGTLLLAIAMHAL